jgi:hypothetical protein
MSAHPIRRIRNRPEKNKISGDNQTEYTDGLGALGTGIRSLLTLAVLALFRVLRVSRGQTRSRIDHSLFSRRPTLALG